MNKLWTTIAIIVLILAFIGYMIFDLVLKAPVAEKPASDMPVIRKSDAWEVEKVFSPGHEGLNAVALAESGNIVLGGKSFLTCYSPSFEMIWEFKTDSEVTSIASYSDRIYAATRTNISVLDKNGKSIDEFGPYDDKAFITSVSAYGKYIVFADAGTKSVYVIDYKGEVKHIIGGTDGSFIVPSPYFDAAIGPGDTVYVANTGKLRIEKRSVDGTLISWFGISGMAPEAFCGCCNPSHFAIFNDGIVTAEKGVNRIKIHNLSGRFIEMVSSENNFQAPLPLDIAVSADGTRIYGAYTGDSKLYIFRRKQI